VLNAATGDLITRIGKTFASRTLCLATCANVRKKSTSCAYYARQRRSVHELASPLATLAVNPSWRRMPAFTTNAELLQEVIEMETQPAAAIVSGILLSAARHV
jgi:hypothetical protein